MSTQSNTSVHWKTMYRKKNLYAGSVVTLFLLRLVVVLLEFFFPKKKNKFVNIFNNETDFQYKKLLSSSMSLAMIIQTCRTYHVWYESDFKIVTDFCLFFTDKVNFFSFLS